MSIPNNRRIASVTEQWRQPNDDTQVTNYPAILASFIAAFVAALVGLMLSFLVVMVIWLFAAHGNESTFQVVRASAIAWQATHLVNVSISGTTIGLLPWGFLIIPVFTISKTMQWAIKSAQPKSAKQFWATAIFYLMFYGAISSLISLISSTAGLRTDFVNAFTSSALLALIVCSGIVLTFSPNPTFLLTKLPKEFVAGLKPGLVIFLIFWLVSSLLTAALLVLRWSEIKTVSGLMAPNNLDQIFLTLLSIGYLPTIITWVYSYLFGATIYLGGSAIVNTSVVAPGALPAFPLLSILPNEIYTWTKYLIIIPVFIGCLIYFLIPREPWKAKGDSLPVALSHTIRIREFIRILAALAVVGVFTWLLASFSSGPLGSAYLSFMGPKALEVSLQTVKVFGIAAIVTLLIPRVILAIIFWWTHRPKSPKPNP